MIHIEALERDGKARRIFFVCRAENNLEVCRRGG